MRLILKTCLLFFFAPLLLGGPVIAVARQTTVTQPPGEKLVLQIYRHAEAEPVYQEVPGTEWSPVFRRVKVEKPARLPAPVRAVRVTSRPEEQGARVNVSLLTGERFHDAEVGVASFVAREGEETVVRELERYGVEPFRVVVLRRSPTTEVPPAVVNKTRSVEAVTAIDRAHRWPVKLVARNLSGRGVLAIGVKTMNDNRVMTSGEPHGEEGLPLIAPGATHENHLPSSRGQATVGGYAPQQVETVVLAAAVFDDGTYEGEPDIAARVLARRAAARVQLERTTPLLREALDAHDADAFAALQRLKRGVSSLGDDAEPRLVEEVLRRFEEPVPGGEKTVRMAAEIAMHHFRKTLLDELTVFERSAVTPSDKRTTPAERQAAPPKQTFRQWLQTKLDAYEKWLARL